MRKENNVFRLLHTADWHIGKKLMDFSRTEEQRRVLEYLGQLADEAGAHAVVVAGDIFDVPNPSADAVRVLTTGLMKLAQDGKRLVIAIAGNHDSAERLESLASWGAALGILLVGQVSEEWTPPSQVGVHNVKHYGKGLIEVSGGAFPFPVRFLLAPYMSVYRLPQDYHEKGIEAYWRAQWEEAMQLPPSPSPTILVAHTYLLTKDKLEEDEDERSLILGNVEAISPSAFPEGLSYVALGHIHKPVLFTERAYPIAYAGSLLQYSFGDCVEEKKVWLVEIDATGKAGSPLCLPQAGGLKGGRAVRRMEASTFGEAQKVIGSLKALPADEQPYIELIWKGAVALSPADQIALREAYPYLVRIGSDRQIQEDGTLPEAEEVGDLSNKERIIQLFKTYYQRQEGKEPDEMTMKLFEEVLVRAQQSNPS
jgi:exonuclease SbcD